MKKVIEDKKVKTTMKEPAVQYSGSKLVTSVASANG